MRLDDQFSEDELMVRDAVRTWVGERFLPVVMEHFEAGTFPHELTPELAELGVFGPTISEEYGGAGLNSVAYGLICQELERGDSGLRSFVSVQGSLVMYPIEAFGSEFFVRDLESRNGTFLNNSPVRYSQLLAGDQITAGRTTLIFRLSNDDIDRG